MVIHWPKQCTPNENCRSTENVIMKFAGCVRAPCFYRLRLLAVIKKNDITNSCEALHNVVNTASEMGNYKAVLWTKCKQISWLSSETSALCRRKQPRSFRKCVKQKLLLLSSSRYALNLCHRYPRLPKYAVAFHEETKKSVLHFFNPRREVSHSREHKQKQLWEEKQDK